jgi:hypothetical protein
MPRLAPDQLKHALNYPAEFVQYLLDLRDEQIALKVALRFTPDKPLEFAQEEATIHAKIMLLESLISANMNPNTRTPEI